MPPVIGRMLTTVSQPDHQMRCARANFVITPRAAINLCGACRRDRPDLVFVSVGSGLDAARFGQRR